jgi:hypothetical protein
MSSLSLKRSEVICHSSFLKAHWYERALARGRAACGGG